MGDQKSGKRDEGIDAVNQEFSRYEQVRKARIGQRRRYE